MATKLPDDVQTMLRLGRGVLAQREADQFGVARQTVRRLAQRDQLVELAKGMYADAESFRSARAWDQFALRSRAFIVSRSDDTHACDFSALIALQLPTSDSPPGLPRGIRPGSAHTGRTTSAHGKVRYGWLPQTHQTLQAGLAVTSKSYTAIDVARHGSRLQGLMVADAVLASGIPLETLANIVDNLDLYHGIQNARWVLEHADGRSESPLETTGRLVCIQFGLPPLVCNPWIVGHARARRADILFPDHGIILEADGSVKYDDRHDASRIVDDEKERDWELRSLGFDVIRFGKRLALERPGELAARVRRTMILRKGRLAPTCWQLDPPWDKP